jgi:hypothetical protein
MSIIALGSGVPVLFWAIMSRMGLLFSRVWTIDIVKEIGDEVAARKPAASSNEVGLAVADNKAYHVHTALVHAEGVDGVTSGPRVANGYFLYTVNNLQVPLVADDFSILPGIFFINFA